MEINGVNYTGFIVTGVKYLSSKRFKLHYSGNYAGYSTANGINLWRGSMWGLMDNGKRKLIKRV